MGNDHGPVNCKGGKCVKPFEDESQASVDGGTIKLAYSDCGDSSTHGHITSLSPTSVVLGTKTSLVGKGKVDEAISAATYKVVAKEGFIPIFSHSGDACKPETIKLPAGAGEIDMKGFKCPLSPGNAELDLDLTLSSKIPAKLARITIELTAKTSGGDKALCVQIKTAPEDLIADGENLIADPSSGEGLQRSSWPWPYPSSSAPNKTVTTYHLFERKYTGLANKDAGDFTGDASFIFSTFNSFEAGNPEASMQHNIIEMSTVTVEDWSREYLKCNAPGAVYSGHGQGLDCPSSNTDYCCTGNRSALTAETLPAYETHGGGYWFSFPKASEGKKWTEKLQRRINGSCVGNAWRKEAGGCSQCGADLDQCVASCIQSALVTTSDHWPHTKDYTKLRSVWDKAFSDKTLCPDQPLPGDETAIIADPASAWPYPSSAPNKTVTTYHLFQRRYTGLANKDAGDFTGDASFIFETFNSFEADNPEASMQHNII